ncbi:pyridoxamine 5'-phosphate oxidase family protein [Dyadobacter tibetensis]|uniref:pyridoxamine 5'-phosphate oxidase family protein n=1 Tax=Dyadobacter tibetensis TaxID=1211851 RepID=UPI000472810A|nr:pyridoxamine 5'-phosphate oxidase family protein [Dyadobacter tibetensis]
METNLIDQKGIDKLKELAEEINICMFTTLEDGEIVSRPMTTLDVDSEGCIWFFTSRDTDLGSTGQVQEASLIYAHPGHNSYMSVKGTWEHVVDEAKKEALWSPVSKAWFPEGKNDPDLVMIRFRSTEASYWDSTSSKMVVFLSLIKSILTGDADKNGVSGEHGTIQIH